MLNQNKFRFFLTTMGILLVFFLPANLIAQTQYTALLPDIDIAIPGNSPKSLEISADNNGTESARSLFLFYLNNLPKNAKVNLLTLRLYVSSIKSTASFSTQPVTVLQGDSKWTSNVPTVLTDPTLAWTDIKNGNKPIGIDEVTKSSQSINLKLKIPGTQKYVKQFLPDGFLSLAARSPQRGQDNYFYSSNTAETPGNFSKKPKLIVKYEVGPYPFRTDWAQSFNSAQHTSYLKWHANEEVTSAGFRLLPNAAKDFYVGADPTGAVLIYKNRPIVFTQSVTGSSSVYSVRQLDGNGKVVWSTGVDDVTKCWPLIDEKGRLYYFSLAGKLSILDLNNSGAIISSTPLSTLTNGQAASISNGATLGYDGTLYLSTDKGLIALSAYPQLKIRWKYDNVANELTGPVSLSPDESKAFFISVNTQQGTSQLVALDNTDGTIMDASTNMAYGYANDDKNYYIPASVVQDNSNVFVLSGHDNGNKLFLFNLNSTTNKLNLANCIVSKSSGNTGISQPVIDASSNVFFIYNNKMARFDTSKQSNFRFQIQ